MYKNNKAFQILVVFLILAALLGCKSQPVYNVENEQFAVRPNASLQQIEEAIIKGCKQAGWRAQVLGPGKLAAAYSYKENKYGALVDITFDRDSYDIKYRSSSANLKYMERAPKYGGGFFADLFDKDSGQQAPGTTVMIHKAYNKWVKDLQENINASLAAMQVQSQAAVAASKPLPAVTAAEPRSGKRRGYSEAKPRAIINCDSKPDTVLSGQGVITKSTAKLRYGASNQCPSAGSVARNEVFTLLGAKDNWFYIQTAQNQVAWIYAPLVKKIDPNAPPPPEPVKKAETVEQQAAAMPTAALDVKPASAPPPPAPPQPATVRKKISIAVIQFKTLNKEAQEIALGDLVSETFTSALVNSSAFKIIEREQLDKVIKEMEFSQTGFIETSNAVAIGKMLHADAIITGSVALLGKQIQLNARIIDIESAYVISAETRTTSYTLDNVSKIAREIVGSLSQKLNN